jgi:hypothetical protein
VVWRPVHEPPEVDEGSTLLDLGQRAAGRRRAPPIVPSAAERGGARAGGRSEMKRGELTGADGGFASPE